MSSKDSFHVGSALPAACTSDGVEVMIGIDEAGRGAVLGPMTYGMALCPVARLDELKTMGFNDSKQLTAKKRDDLFAKIKKNEDWMAWEVHHITPHEISTSSFAKGKYSLNDLSHDSAMNLMQRAIDNGANITKCFVDTVGIPGFYAEKIRARFPNITEVVVESKADATYAITGAASICAKVLRDEAMEMLACAETSVTLDKDAGCGYPGDAKTVKWLGQVEHQDHVFGFCSAVRFSWAPIKTMLASRDNKRFALVDFGDESDDDDADQKPNKIRPKSFFQPKRARFYEERQIDLVQSFSK